MNYEKKYKEALERMKSWVNGEHPECFCEAQKAAEFIFPELKESEDERVRKAIYNALKYLELELSWDFVDEVDILDVYAWLEKQGEQPTDKVEPKFKVGDWVISNNKKSIYQVIEVKRGIYVIRDNVDNHEYHIGIEECEKSGRLWSINDAKDGDVLVDEDNNIGLYLEEKDDVYWHSRVYLGCDDYLRGAGGYHKHKNTKPATKEQCDFLFQKMKEAGYEWDAENKEVKKIEPKFKVGDWVILNGTVAQILDKQKYGFVGLDIDGKVFFCNYGHTDSMRLWTIADAKDGDVLATDYFIFIYKNIDSENGVHYYCQYEISKHQDDEQFDIALPQSLMGRVNSGMHYKPATKEQRDLLFQKMKEAGYEWDSEKKKFKKIEVANKESEDGRIRRGIIRNLEYLKSTSVGFVAEELQERIDWLEKQGEPKTDCPQNHQDVNHPNGCIVKADFNGGEGFYKLHLDYLSKKHVEEVEEMVRTWNKEPKTSNENIKNCVEMCLTDANEQRFEDFGTTLKDCLAWLEKQKPNNNKREIDDAYLQGICDAKHVIEKQGEQPTDKIDTKFKVGDWIVNTNSELIWKITSIRNYIYYIRDVNGKEGYETYDGLRDNYHLWSINDAKDGDVLVNGSNIFIFHFLNGTRLMGYCHVNINDGRFYDDIGKIECFCLIDAEVTPATKEQRDFLSQKMAEECYVWDSEKKELKMM